MNHTQDKELKRLIASYFDGDTTLAEERHLRELLAHCDDHSAEAEEARAVLSLFSTGRQMQAQGQLLATPRQAKPTHRKQHHFMRVAIAAAAVTILFAAATALLLPSADFSGNNGKLFADLKSPGKTFSSNSASVCYANIGGETTNDQAAVEAIVFSQLGEIGEASGNLSKTVDNEISTISELIKLQNNI